MNFAWLEGLILGVLILIAVYYGLAAILEGIMGSKPPGIVHLGYMLLTVFGFLSASKLITAQELRESITKDLEVAMIRGDLNTTITLNFLLCPLILVVANLMRSYFNLHDIEKIKRHSRLARTIMYLDENPPLKHLEFVLRVCMFVIIVFINKKIVNMAQGGTENFLDGFIFLWRFATLFYVVLLAWDVLLLLWSRSLMEVSSQGTQYDDAAQAKKIILVRALPVHLFGLFSCAAIWLGFENSVILYVSTAVAGVLAVIGLIYFLVAAAMDWERVWDTLRGVG